MAGWSLHIGPLDTHPSPGAQLSSFRQVFGDECGLCPLYLPTPSRRGSLVEPSLPCTRGQGPPGFAVNRPPLSLTSSSDIHSPSLLVIISIPPGTVRPLRGESSQGTFWPGLVARSVKGDVCPQHLSTPWTSVPCSPSRCPEPSLSPVLPSLQLTHPGR